MKAVSTLEVVTTLLDLAGLALIVAGVFVAFGIAAALVVAGACLLVLSVALTRGRPPAPQRPAEGDS